MAKYYRNKENIIFDAVVVALVVLVLLVRLLPALVSKAEVMAAMAMQQAHPTPVKAKERQPASSEK